VGTTCDVRVERGEDSMFLNWVTWPAVGLAFLVLSVIVLPGCEWTGEGRSISSGQSVSVAEPTTAPTETPTPIFADVLPENRPLKVLLVDHPTSKIIQNYIGEFEETAGVRVDVEIASFYEAHQKQLLDFGAGNNQYDVMMVIDTWLPEFAISDNILNLSRQIRRLEQEGNRQWLSDIIPNVNVLLGQWQGRQVAIPLMASAQILMYRKDLFEDADQQQAFERFAGRPLAVPRTWAEFNEVARFFTRAFNSASPTQYGIAVAAQAGNSAACQFQTVLWGVGGREFARRWRVTLNNQEGIKAMELWAEQAQYAPPDAPNMYWYDMNRVFAAGEAAMQVQWDVFARELETSLDSAVRGKVGYALVPGEPTPAPVIAGWVLVINKNSARIPLAWEFIKWCCGPDLGYTINWEGGQVPRMSLYTDEKLRERFPHYETALLSLEAAQQRTSFAPGGPTLPAQTQYEDIVGRAAHSAFIGDKLPQEAIDDAAEKLGAMLEQIGWR